MDDALTRRRSPGWVRALTDREVHAMAFRFSRDRQSVDLSAAQEWLWDRLISELEYRRRTTRPGWQRCSCELCVPPFED